jgi:DNA polymerase-1
LIIDGRHLVYRTGDAFRTLSVETKEGDYVGTGVLFGFLSVLIRLKQEFGGRVYVAWEGDTNFRKTIYPEYKKRNKKPLDDERLAILEDLREQEATLKGVLSQIGVRQFAGVDCEADDVIGTLATKASAHGLQVMIYSGDADVRQLVADSVLVASPGKKGVDKVYDAEAVKGKHGVGPERIVDFKTLAGDSSDNIPGVRGVGPKRALEYLDAYATVEEVGAAAESGELKLTPKIKEAFDVADLVLMKRLVTILTDAPMKALPVEKDHGALLITLAKFKLRSLLDPMKLKALKGLSA